MLYFGRRHTRGSDASLGERFDFLCNELLCKKEQPPWLKLLELDGVQAQLGDKMHWELLVLLEQHDQQESLMLPSTLDFKSLRKNLDEATAPICVLWISLVSTEQETFVGILVTCLPATLIEKNDEK